MIKYSHCYLLAYTLLKLQCMSLVWSLIIDSGTISQVRVLQRVFLFVCYIVRHSLKLAPARILGVDEGEEVSVQCMGKLGDKITWYFSPFQYGEAKKVSHNHTLFIPAMHYYNSGQYYCVKEMSDFPSGNIFETLLFVGDISDSDYSEDSDEGQMDENRDEGEDFSIDATKVITRKIEILIKGKQLYTKAIHHVRCNIRPIFKKKRSKVSLSSFSNIQNQMLQ